MGVTITVRSSVSEDCSFVHPEWRTQHLRQEQIGAATSKKFGDIESKCETVGQAQFGPDPKTTRMEVAAKQRIEVSKVTIDEFVGVSATRNCAAF
jgi:hypothetical protein